MVHHGSVNGRRYPVTNGHFAYCTSTSSGRCSCEILRYLFILFITVIVFCIQMIGGRLFGSLALYADSAHVALDGVVALISMFVAVHVRQHRNEEVFRVRWMRVSALLLLLTLVWIVAEAFSRLANPEPVVGFGVFVAASIGGLGNVLQHRLLHHGERTVTARAQRLHVEGDLWSSVMVVAGGIAIWMTDLFLIDPILSIAVALFIGIRTIRLIGDVHHH